MKRSAIDSMSPLCVMIVVFVLFSACDKMSNLSEGGGSNANLGAGNTKDIAVTGGVTGVGMTYADLKGYVNIPSDVIVDATAKNLIFQVGVLFGESQSSLTRRAYGARNDRDIAITVSNVQAGKTYYYKTFLEVGNYVYDPLTEDWIDVFNMLGTGTEIGSFTTKEVKYDGAITANEARDVTFFHADISGKVDLSSLNAKETITRGYVWSTDRNDLADQLAGRLGKAHYEDTPYDKIRLVSDQGYFAEGNLHFFVGEETNVRLYSDPGTYLYYSPFLIISGISFVGEPGEVTLRSLSQTSGYVDLGLSCEWAATNIAAASPWEMGNTKKAGYTSSKLANEYGSGLRLPSKEEIDELNRRCTFEAIDNGVLITGPNGNQIFIPGQSLADSYRSSNVLINNTYLSSSTKVTTTFGSRDEYQTGYFYSANDNGMWTTDLPVLSYPYNNNLNYYVRPVRDGSGSGDTDYTSKVVGFYSVTEFKWASSTSSWEVDDSYEMELIRDPQYSNQVYIKNFWNVGASVYGEVQNNGNRISIPSGQYLFTYDDNYGDVLAYTYDPDTRVASNDGEIVLEYDSSYGLFRSSYFMPVCDVGSFGAYYIEMKRK